MKRDEFLLLSDTALTFGIRTIAEFAAFCTRYKALATKQANK